MNKTYKKWTYTDKMFVINNANRLTDKEMSKVLQRPKTAVTKERQRLNIKKKSGRGKCEVIGKFPNLDIDI